MDKQAEGLLGCIAVPAVLAFVLYAVWPSQSTRDRVDKGVQRDQQIFAAQDRVKAQLRDPSSAEFADTFVPHEGTSAVCGTVRSRNGFGGMVAQRFVVSSTGVIMEEQHEAAVPGSFAGFWQQVCA